MQPNEPSLVPELLVRDVSASLDFWCGLCGFTIRYRREQEGFAYIESGTTHVMLEQEGVGRNWVTGDLQRPLGRGINFQINVDDTDSLLQTIAAAGRPIFMGLETKWYAVSATEEAGVEQFLVTDPDGYLLRFQSSLGRRTISPGTE